MNDLLNSQSALHNCKQANGIYEVSANSVSAYKLERKLLRILKTEISFETALKVARASGFSVIEIENLAEGKAYDLGEQQLLEVLDAYEEGGISACLKAIHLADTEVFEAAPMEIEVDDMDHDLSHAQLKEITAAYEGRYLDIPEGDLFS